jgi:hypothetical protein
MTKQERKLWSMIDRANLMLGEAHDCIEGLEKHNRYLLWLANDLQSKINETTSHAVAEGESLLDDPETGSWIPGAEAA